jgi:hypothetical protein
LNFLKFLRCALDWDLSTTPWKIRRSLTKKGKIFSINIQGMRSFTKHKVLTFNKERR